MLSKLIREAFVITHMYISSITLGNLIENTYSIYSNDATNPEHKSFVKILDSTP